jgi:hypothetical protein
MVDWTEVASIVIGDSLVYLDFQGEVLPLKLEIVKELYVPRSETGEILPGMIISVILEYNGEEQICFASPQEGTKISIEELMQLMGTEPEGEVCLIYKRRNICT